MNIGEKFELAWKHPHRITVEITALESDMVVVNAEHRCGFVCALKTMKSTLPIEDEMRYRYGDFHELFLPLNPDAVALSARLT